MSSLNLVDGSYVRAVAIYDRHTLDHQIKQRSSFSSVIRILGHCLLRGKITSHGFLPPIHCKSVPGIISSYPCLWSLRQLHLVETAISSARLTFEVFSGFDS